MKSLITSISFALVIAVSLGGCSSFSKSGRQQRAYQKYVRKSSVARAKQSKRLRPTKSDMPPQPMPSEPVESTGTSPEAMPAESSGG